MSEQNYNPQLAALSELIENLGIDILPQDKQNDFIIRMTELLLNRIFLKTMEKLGEKGREEYEKMSEGDVEPEQVEAFFAAKIDNYDKMVESAIEEFKGEMMIANK